MFGRSLISSAQNHNLPGLIPSILYKGRITNHFDYNLFASTTFIPIKSVIESKKYSPRNSEIYLQPSLIYKYSQDLNFSLGYTYIHSNSFSIEPENEQQLWQQAIVEHSLFKGLMLHRLRIIENIKKDISPVLNYQVAFEKPLQGRVLDVGEFYFTCFNESFLNLTSHTNFYAANWFFAGVGYKTFKAGKIEIGPLIQSTFNPSTNESNTLYLLQILWLTDYKFFKKTN